jgi:hypothetical protein
MAISLAIITACYKIARSFISEMIKINNQRLNLTKISIIAKDVSMASEHDLNLSDEDIYRLRSELKMQLLKDHLKEYLSKGFTVPMPQSLLLNRLRRRDASQQTSPETKEADDEAATDERE